jgi:hypothetical protein
MGNNIKSEKAKFCKCTRCKNIHKSSERIEQANPKSVFRDLICPRCGAKPYYDISELQIYKMDKDNKPKPVKVKVLDIVKTRKATYFVHKNDNGFQSCEYKSGLPAVENVDTLESLISQLITTEPSKRFLQKRLYQLTNHYNITATLNTL